MTSFRRPAGWLLLAFLLLGSFPSANAIPAFARKYGLRCSACHEAWPMLNYFGQKFKDNGYQLMNDRDAPIWQNPSYWPVTFRMTPIWHREAIDKNATDQGQKQITTTGFDLTGLDFHTGGTLEKNLSFYLLPSSDPTGAFHFETVMARVDNLFHSSWFNLKFGKFELDNLVSEKRILTLSTFGGFYQIYHFIPVGDGNIFGQIGDNQLGMEVMGHSVDDRTRYSAALLSSNDGNVNLTYGNGYTGFFTASQAFDTGKLGVQRIGAYAMVGSAPINYLTSGGVAIPGAGSGNKSFNREGFVGQFYFGNKLDFQVVTQHGWDNAWFGAGYGDPVDLSTGLNATTAPILPAGTRAPTWNGAFVEAHYVVNPQFILIVRPEFVDMSRQAFASSASNLGNLKTYVFGYRWMPIMTSRAGFAWFQEYSWNRQTGTAPDGTDLTSSSLMMGIDFDF